MATIASSRASLFFVWAGVLFASLANFAAYPIIGVGVWGQSEPVIAFVFSGSGVAALGLLLYAFSGQRPKQRIINLATHPLTLMPAAIALWSIMIAPFHAVPMRTMFGAPELGEGGFLYIAIAILTISGLLLRRTMKHRHYFSWLILAIIVSITLSHILFVLGWVEHAPYYFRDYLAFLAIYAFVIMRSIPIFRKGWTQIAAIALPLLIILVSSNYAALLIAAGLVPAYGLACTPFLRNRLWLRISLSIMAFIATTTVLLGFGYYYGDGSTLDVDTSLKSVWSRAQMILIIAKAATISPESWLIGKGWGSFSDQQVSYLPVQWLDLVFGDGPDWEGIFWAHFHSHHMIFDSFLAGGLIMAALFLGYLSYFQKFVSIRLEKESFLFSIYMIPLACLWFQMPGTFPLMALSFAIMARPARPIKRNNKAVQSTVITILIISMTFLAFGGYATYKTALNYTDYGPAKTEHYTAKKTGDCPDAPNDFHRGGLHMMSQLRGYTNELFRMISSDKHRLTLDLKDVKLTQREEQHLHHIICMADRYATQPYAGERIKLMRLLIRTDLALALASHLKENNISIGLLDSWEEHLRNFLSHKFTRYDVAVGYLQWRFMLGQEDRVLKFSEFMLEQDVNNPVGLWFSGLVLLNDPQRGPRGIQRMKLALDKGIQRIIPIEDNIIQSLKQVEIPE